MHKVIVLHMHKTSSWVRVPFFSLHFTSLSIRRIGAYTEESLINYNGLRHILWRCFETDKNISALGHRRRDMCNKIFNSTVNNANHKLYNLLPTSNVNCEHSLRHSREFNIPHCKTNRLKNSFIMVCASNRV